MLKGAAREVGETQSPPGVSVLHKTASFAQAGIYAIGQFANIGHDVHKNRSLASIVLFKDMSAAIGLATISTSEEGRGKVNYEYVDLQSASPT